MTKQIRYFFAVTAMVFALHSTGAGTAFAGTKDLTASKKSKFKDDQSVSFNDYFEQKAKKDSQMHETMLEDNKKIIALLTQIKDQLIILNAKK